MINLNAWQFMIWILGLAILLSPIIVVTVNSIIISFYKAKSAYVNKNLKALSSAFEQITNTLDMGNKKESRG